ncbi:peptidase [Sinirhodobacter sp. WL0062]|uniref:Peptidase n=1 Tax=Rhodobacter flavimaris TaxID=2907145 RepID=A0ABS8YQD9_9RHOB|nr:peptidase [Sinirhodobacter sp. WL0062]MCE5972097.1 peptidase [Sinirhodobacter sp. WL0062]
MTEALVGAKRGAALALAREWIGTPYQHQASVKGAGTDCLGLLRGIWRTLYGCEPEAIPAYTPDWSEPAREERILTSARRLMIEGRGAIVPGQVLVFRMRDGAVAKHLGLMSADGERAAFIHAYTGHGVIESPFSTPWRRRVVAHFDFP